MDQAPALLSTIQAAIMQLMVVRAPAFQQFGYDLFLLFALIRVSQHAIRSMFGRHFGDSLSEFVELALELSFGFAMIAFYEAPFPGVGISFSNMITGTMEWFARILDSGALQNAHEHVMSVFDRFVQPGWDIVAGLMYLVLLAVVVFTQIVAIMAIAGAMIATAVCGLLGPIFVPFFIMPPLRWLFDGWLRAFITNAFVNVVALAYLMIFEVFIAGFQLTLPAEITEDLYPLYIINAIVMIGAFGYEMLHVRALAASIISGHGHTGGGGGLTRLLMGGK